MIRPLADEAATQALGEEIGRAIRSAAAGALIALEGPMGAGKTTFVRGLARGLGARGPVASPTFQILRVHAAASEDGAALWHVDLYRLPAGSEEFRSLDVDAAVARGAVVAGEWADRAPRGAMDSARRIRLEYDGAARRAAIE